MKSKPFIKWVGSKTQLIKKIDQVLIEDFDSLNNVTIRSYFLFQPFCSVLSKRRFPATPNAIGCII